MIYSTAASLLLAKRPHNCDEKILGLKKRVEANELHWDEVYDKVRKSLQALRMREGRLQKKLEEEGTFFSTPEQSTPPQAPGSPPSSETPSSSAREDLREEIQEHLL